jgi:hypothetical protein
MIRNRARFQHARNGRWARKLKIRKMTLAVAAGAAVSMAAPAVAGATTIHVYTNGFVSANMLRKFERAAGQVANGTLRYEWSTPYVNWSRRYGSMNMIFAGDAATVQRYCGSGAAACHTVVNGAPVALVDAASWADFGEPWTIAASHELFEMLVDPQTNATTAFPDGSGNAWMTEVADPVQNYWWWVGGIRISDFVYPAWFENTTGQQDAMSWLDDTTAGTGTYETAGYANYYNPYGNTLTLMRHKIRRVHVSRAMQSRLKGFALARVRRAGS